MFSKHIRPELHVVPALGQSGDDLLDVVEVHLGGIAGHHSLALVNDQLKRFVRTDIDPSGTEVARELLEQVTHKLGVLGGGLHGCRGAVLVHHQKTLGVQGPIAIFGMRQPPFHVAERVLVGHQRNTARHTLVIEPVDVRGGERRRIHPDIRMIGIRKGVLHIELEVVDARE